MAGTSSCAASASAMPRKPRTSRPRAFADRPAEAPDAPARKGDCSTMGISGLIGGGPRVLEPHRMCLARPAGRLLGSRREQVGPPGNITRLEVTPSGRGQIDKPQHGPDAVSRYTGLFPWNPGPARQASDPESRRSSKLTWVDRVTSSAVLAGELEGPRSFHREYQRRPLPSASPPAIEATGAQGLGKRGTAHDQGQPGKERGPPKQGW